MNLIAKKYSTEKYKGNGGHYEMDSRSYGLFNKESGKFIALNANSEHPYQSTKSIIDFLAKDINDGLYSGIVTESEYFEFDVI